MVGCLFDKFAAVDDDQGLVAVLVARGDSTNELREDDLA